MQKDVQPAQSDPETLRQMVALLQAELKSRDLLIEKLKHQLAGLRRHRFGSSSEALDQLELVLESEEIAAAGEEIPELPEAAPEAKAKILRQFAAALNPKGILFLGASESIAGLTDEFDMVRCNPGIYYQKKN